MVGCRVGKWCGPVRSASFARGEVYISKKITFEFGFLHTILKKYIKIITSTSSAQASSFFSFWASTKLRIVSSATVAGLGAVWFRSSSSRYECSMWSSNFVTCSKPSSDITRCVLVVLPRSWLGQGLAPVLALARREAAEKLVE